MGKISSWTEVRRAQIVTLYGERYTERNIAAILHCSKTAMNNDIAKCNADGIFHETERFGRPRKTA